MSSSHHSEKSVQFARRIYGLVLIAAFLIFFAQTRSFMLLFDGLTYAALAKNILRTGDWKTLHYGLEQYANFYQHPPLAIWMQAAVMSVLGTAEWVTRIVPSFCGVLTVGFVFKFTEKKLGLSAAFWASIVLLTSTRFIKWGSNFYLDGILAFFCFGAFAFWMLSIRTSPHELNLAGHTSHLKDDEANHAYGLGTAFLSGLFLSCAFMTKGVVAFGVAAVMAMSLLFSFQKRTFLCVLMAGVGAILPLFLWFKLGDGYLYLQQYLNVSVSGRVGADFNLGPWNNIWKIWWPWWPVLIVAAVSAVKEARTKNFTPLLILSAAMVFPIGFSLGSSYLEHYLTPFYPFAAVMIGYQLSKVRFFHINENAVKSFGWLVAITAIFLATVSPDVNAQKETPVMKWIQAIHTLPESTQNEIKIVVFTEKTGDLWLSLATILGRTPWQSIGAFSPVRAPLAKSVLISKRDEAVASGWKPVDCIFSEGVRFYQSPDLSLCPLTP
jgi:4-amino-4-deoxy-L-arabinose transferase-like glycosyltransferase